MQKCTHQEREEIEIMNNINLIGWFGVTVAGLMMYKSV